MNVAEYCDFVLLRGSYSEPDGSVLRVRHVCPADVPDSLAAGGDGLLLQKGLQGRRSWAEQCVSSLPESASVSGQSVS